MILYSITRIEIEAQKPYHQQGEDIQVIGVPRFLSVNLDAPPDERVLPHQNHRISPQSLSDVLELVGPHIVSDSDQHLGVLL